MRYFVLAALVVVGCSAMPAERGTTPPSLAVAPPWIYSKKPPPSYPSSRPNRPAATVVVEVEKPTPAPVARSAPSPSPDLEDKIDDIQQNIDALRRELRK